MVNHTQQITGENDVFQKCYRISLGSPQTMEKNEFPLQTIVEMHWACQIALCHQLCHGGFTTNITGSSNMVCMFNCATEDLQ